MVSEAEAADSAEGNELVVIVQSEKRTWIGRSTQSWDTNCTYWSGVGI